MIMSIRNQRGDIRQRILAYSSDGGQTWENVHFEDQLPDPVCQASILSIGEIEGKTILAHSNAADTEERNYLTIKISYDEGQTWDHIIPVDYTGDSALLPWTAYSDLVKLDQKKLGILYERNQYQEIIFKILAWSPNF